MSDVDLHENAPALLPSAVRSALVLSMRSVVMEAVQAATGAAPPIDQARAEAFGERMLGVVNDACLALMTSIGHQVGLFDTLAGLPPATSEQIADAAGLQERYAREWLGAMTASEVVEYDPGTQTYRLPPRTPPR